MQMSLAAALKKGQAVADTLGDWDPFPEAKRAGSEGDRSLAPRQAAPKPAVDRRPQVSPAGSAAANVNATERRAAKPAARLRAVEAPAAPARGDAEERRRASWLQDGLPQRNRVNAAQYIRELERFAAEESRRAVADAVMDVNPSEIEGVAKLAARIKGRYLAKLLDLGNPTKSTVQDAEIRELTRYRETHEELARGLEMLKAAIEAGDVGVSGTVRR